MRPEHRNFHGTAHGGLIFALADTAFAVASNSHGPPAFAAVAAIHYVRPAEPGQVLVAEAQEISLEPRVATYLVTVAGPRGLVASFTGTVFRTMDSPPTGENQSREGRR